MSADHVMPVLHTAGVEQAFLVYRPAQPFPRRVDADDTMRPGDRTDGAGSAAADVPCVFCAAALPTATTSDRGPRVCTGCAHERAENGYVFAPPGFGLDTCHGTNPAALCRHPSHEHGLPINRLGPPMRHARGERSAPTDSER